MTSIDVDDVAAVPGGCGDDGGFDGEVRVLVDPGLPGWAEDVDLVDIAMGWLSGDPLALTAVGDRLFDRLAGCPLDRLSDEQLRTVAAETERLVARLNAVSADATGEIERRGHDRESGFFSTRAVIEHRHRLSRATSTERTQTMRMFELLPGWADAARRGTVGADHVALMARTAANPRIGDELIEFADDLLVDARSLSYQAFEDRVRMFVRLADVDGTRTVDQRNRDRRDVTLDQLPDGSWRLRGRLPAVAGAQINETFAHFIDAEFHTDLTAAREAADDGAEPAWSDLARSEPQRRADALLAIANSAAAAPYGRPTPLPTLGVLFDVDSLAATLDGQPVPVARYREVVCRTRRGHQLPLDEAAAMTLWAHVRRVVSDGASTVIDLGRRRRLFRGNARDAALMLHTNCVWPGCTVHAVDCEADHARTWKHHGATAPGNGLPLCKRHNLHKERHQCTARRDEHGHWTIYRADGTPID